MDSGGSEGGGGAPYSPKPMNIGSTPIDFTIYFIFRQLLNLNSSETFYVSNGLLFFCLGSRVGNFEDYS